MELSRRGVLGGLGAACAVGAVGFAGATSVTDDASDGENAVGGSGDSDDGSGDSDTGSVEVDPDAPFQAHLLGGDGTDSNDGNDEDLQLFDASDLGRVEGIFAENDEHLVYVALGDAGIETFQERLTDSGATDDPADFVVSMTLDGREVRRVELDESTVTALTDDEWGGVLTLPFAEESVAESVYESLAAT